MPTFALLDEPVAALVDFVNHNDAGSFLSESFNKVLVFDYGGGTRDLALMKARPCSSQSDRSRYRNPGGFAVPARW